MAAMTDFGLGWAIRRVDALLRRRLGIVEFCDDPGCVLRISRGTAPRPIALPSGASIPAGASIVEVHLWNDRMPPIPPGGGTAAWGNLFKRQLRHSLALLARYIEREPSCRDVAAISGRPVYPVRLGPGPLTRVCEHLGWEVVPWRPERRDAVKAWFDSVLIWLLIREFNPEGARGRGLAHGHIEVWMTRSRLLDRYPARTDIKSETTAMVEQS